MQCFDTFREFLYKIYAATMDGKGRDGKYISFTKTWGQPGEAEHRTQGAAASLQFCWRRPCSWEWCKFCEIYGGGASLFELDSRFCKERSIRQFYCLVRRPEGRVFGFCSLCSADPYREICPWTALGQTPVIKSVRARVRHSCSPPHFWHCDAPYFWFWTNVFFSYVDLFDHRNYCIGNRNKLLEAKKFDEMANTISVKQEMSPA